MSDDDDERSCLWHANAGSFCTRFYDSSDLNRQFSEREHVLGAT